MTSALDNLSDLKKAINEIYIPKYKQELILTIHYPGDVMRFIQKMLNFFISITSATPPAISNYKLYLKTLMQANRYRVEHITKKIMELENDKKIENSRYQGQQNKTDLYEAEHVS